MRSEFFRQSFVVLVLTATIVSSHSVDRRNVWSSVLTPLISSGTGGQQIVFQPWPGKLHNAYSME